MEKDYDVTKKIIFWIIRITVIIVAIIVICIFARRIIYKNNLRKTTEIISRGILEAEFAGNYTYEVFRNWTLEIDDKKTNYYTMDFAGRFHNYPEDVFYSLNKDQQYKMMMTSIDSYTNESRRMIEKISKFPHGFENDYSLVLAYYDDYCNLANFIQNPNIDIRLYRDSFIKYDSQAANDLEIICNEITKIYLPEDSLMQYNTGRTFDTLNVYNILKDKKKEPWYFKYIDK